MRAGASGPSIPLPVDSRRPLLPAAAIPNRVASFPFSGGEGEGTTRLESFARIRAMTGTSLPCLFGILHVFSEQCPIWAAGQGRANGATPLLDLSAGTLRSSSYPAYSMSVPFKSGQRPDYCEQDQRERHFVLIPFKSGQRSDL